jgi:pre-mRNA-splicing helicase BRR2
MRNDPELVWILQALSETDRNEAVKEGRERRVSSKKSREGDDGDQEAMDTENGTTEVSTNNPQHVVNLEDLVFAQGSHFMANKSCRLPDGSYRLQKKGYEEVHVPALKPSALDPGEVNFT